MTSSSTARELESRTQAIGRELLERLRASRPRPWHGAWWQEQMLRQFMADEWLKVQSFRFVDALPALPTSAAVARQLREYLGAAANPLPAPDMAPSPGYGRSPAAQLVRQWTNWRRDDGLRARLTGWAARKAAFAMSGSFIAGSNVDEAEAAIVRMRGQNLAFTIDLLGEAALTQDEADHYHRKYIALLAELPKRAAAWTPRPQIDHDGQGNVIPPVNVSVKITAIFPGFDPLSPERAKARAKELLRPLIRQAIVGGCHLHVDMEHYAIKDLTLELVRELFSEPEFRGYPHLGVVLQAYLVDADRDVEQMIEYARERGTPMWVRLVKGAYWDSEYAQARREHWPCPVWTQKWQSDACYERCARRLVAEHRVIRTAFASHNVRSLAHAIALRDLYGAPREAFELQMLFGMGDPIKLALAQRGERCRVYTPYGDVLPGMAYLIRRLLENTANESFLRQGSSDDVPADVLLRDPVETGRLQPEPSPPPDFACVTLPQIQKDGFVNIADTDFARHENRAQMLAALRQVRDRAQSPAPLRIGGEARDTGDVYEAPNPANPAEIVGRVARAGTSHVDQAVAAAAAAFPAWRATPTRTRADLLFETAARLHTRRFEFAAMLVLELGKSWTDADSEVSEGIDYLNFYAHQSRTLGRVDDPPDAPGESNIRVEEPRGVTAAIGPWNFPLAIFANLVAAPLVCGNTVVAKPATRGSYVGARLIELFHEAGCPAGVLNLLVGPGESLGPALVQHPLVETVAFAGSRAVGAQIHALAAGSLTARPGFRKPVLNLGGKNAVIVDADADLDEAIAGVRAGAFGFAGQKCTSVSRVIVLHDVYDRFVTRLVDAAAALRLGPAEEPGGAVPPLIDAAAADLARKAMEEARATGKVLFEGTTPKELAATGGHYVAPAIVAKLPNDSRLLREELSAPILCVQRAANFEEAIALFNRAELALVGGLYSRSPANIAQARAECICGNLYINRRISGSKVGRQPFGGLKLSGAGARIGGPHYLREFCEPRTVTENTLRRGFAPPETAEPEELLPRLSGH
jgi:RHH-type proline utilization regulon transcriptional repressor/proline dehydrogenase/delta 1-pyrroline-5-carboxylate dehydrogenase